MEEMNMDGGGNVSLDLRILAMLYSVPYEFILRLGIEGVCPMWVDDYGRVYMDGDAIVAHAGQPGYHMRN